MTERGENKKLQTYEEDDIVRYSMGLDIPIVGLVRDRGEYREMREIAVIYGAALGLARSPKAEAEPLAGPPEAPRRPAAPRPPETLV